METAWTVEGEWSFDITFDEGNSDYREIEFVTDSTTMAAITGWALDGTDIFGDVEVFSFSLRAMSATIRYNFDGTVDFNRYDMPMYVVMKDGSRIELKSTGGNPGVTWYTLESTIDVDHVDHILLMDGTKLPVPET